MLSQEQLDEYDKNGILIVESVFSDSEVEQFRKRFHDQLLKYANINHDQVLTQSDNKNNNNRCLESRFKGKASQIFYAKWKLDCHLDPRIYNIMKQLIVTMYGEGDRQNYDHIYGKFDDIIPYIDRICWRLPDCIKAEGGLGMHLDRNPYDPYLLKSKQGGGIHKWKPIQAILILTDHWGTNTGGLQVVKGFHKEIDKYFSAGSIYDKPNDGGEFFRMNSKVHNKLNNRLQPINAPKGSLICWDNRLPHATSEFLSGHDTRECVYIGYMPSVPINVLYHSQQFNNIKINIPPPAFCDNKKNIECVDKDWKENELSELQKCLIGFK
jgi:hypothetical protein